MRICSVAAEPLLEDSTSSARSNPATSNSLVSDLPLEDDETNVLVRRLLISMQKSNHSRRALEIFESESRNTDGASGKQLKKRPMFLDPPDNFRITGTRRKKSRYKEKIMMKHRSSLSSSTTVTTPAANPPRRRRSDPSHREWRGAGTSAPEIEQIELKKRLSYEQLHAHQQQPQQGCFGQMRSFHIRDLNTDNHSAIQYQHHHHPQHHQQHFAVTMHHHHQFQNHNPRYYPNTYPENDNAAAEFVARNGWSWSFQTGMRY
jgi:hypothetical protein